MTGAVEHGKYETSIELNNIGVISGRDITTETALAKLMYLFGEGFNHETITALLHTSLRGEITIK
jgi:L-asparaginase